MLQEPGSYVGEVIKVMGKTKVLVKVRRRPPTPQNPHSHPVPTCAHLSQPLSIFLFPCSHCPLSSSPSSLEVAGSEFTAGAGASLRPSLRMRSHAAYHPRAPDPRSITVASYISWGRAALAGEAACRQDKLPRERVVSARLCVNILTAVHHAVDYAAVTDAAHTGTL